MTRRLTTGRIFRGIAIGYLAIVLLLGNFPLVALADEIAPDTSEDASLELAADDTSAPEDSSVGDSSLSAAEVETLSVVVKANGANDHLVLNPGEGYVYTWESTGATSCQLTAPENSGATLSGSSATIPSNHPWYPSVGSSVTISLRCVRGSESVSDSVVVSLASVVPTLSVDIKANSSNGPVTLSAGEGYVYSWESTGATSCQLTSPENSGATLSGASAIISAGHPWYPSATTSVTLTMRCVNGSSTATDSVVVNLATLPPPPGAVTVDIKANNSNGPVTLSAGEGYVYTWESTGATSCQLTAPENSGATLSGASAVIPAGHPWYPSVGAPVTLTMRCVNGSTVAFDSVLVQLVTPPPPPPPPGVLPVVDVKANNSDGPISITTAESYVFSWTSTNATSCQQVTPENSGIALTGATAAIGLGHPWFPGTTTPVTLTVRCTNAAGSHSDSVVVNLAPILPPAAVVTVDIKANNSDGPVTLTPGQTYVYTWTSTNATSCQLISPENSGATLSGASAAIGSGHPWYPTAGNPVTLTMRCTNGSSTAVDSVVVNLGIIGCPVPVITSGLSVSVDEDTAFSYTLTASGSSVTLSATGLPSWLSFTPSTGVLSGTPADPGTYNVTLTATNPCGTDTRTLVITVNDTGGGGGGGHHHHSSSGVKVTPQEDLSCLYIKDYMRRDFNNDPIEVMKLQAFLQVFEGDSYVSINGVYDDATIQGVNAFQMKYKDDILTPWGHTAPTSYVYILTLKKVNEIYCQHILPLSEAQAREIVAFRELLEGFRARGIPVDNLNVGGSVIIPNDSNGTTTIDVPIVGVAEPSDGSKGQNLNLAAALFAGPDNLRDALQCIYEFLLILIVLYVLSSVLEDVLYKDIPENGRKRFFAKWTAMSLGLVIAIVIAYLLGEWCLLLPLLVSLIVSLIWMGTYPYHESLHTKTKSWFVITSPAERKGDDASVLIIEEKKK